jgi:MFS family permease
MASSLIYSTALINGTLAVYFGHILYQKFSVIKLISLMIILPIIGLFFSSSGSWIGWIVGYGVFFGFSSGIGYGLSLHIASSVTDDNKLGFRLGLVTASYAFGAVIFSVIFPILFDNFGFENGYFLGLGTLLIIVTIGLFLFIASKVKIGTDTSISQKIKPHKIKIFKLWLGYFLGVFAGLMTIAHAVPLISSFGGSAVIAITAISLMSLGSGIASVCTGWLVDRFGCKRPLVVILIINSFAILGLSIMTSIDLLFIMLILIASLYGAIIAIYPTLINHLVGQDLSALVYGKVFTAWGAAGLASPALAGWLFEINNNYDVAILFILTMSVIAIFIIWTMEYSNKN